MYAACSFTDGQVTGVPGLTTFGQVGTWVAFAAVLVALAGRFRHAHRAGRPRAAARSSRENGYLPAERTP
jgi:hypothetical protein